MANQGPIIFREESSADIFRGRYRESLETPKAVEPDKPFLYRFALPTANHVFLPGHRIMVQVQSSWFPLYDRNPQTFVPKIMWAKPGDYRKAARSSVMLGVSAHKLGPSGHAAAASDSSSPSFAGMERDVEGGVESPGFRTPQVADGALYLEGGATHVETLEPAELKALSA